MNVLMLLLGFEKDTMRILQLEETRSVYENFKYYSESLKSFQILKNSFR